MVHDHKDGPRISPAWFAELLAGEAHCQWAYWFRARHEEWELGPSLSLSRVDWLMEHTWELIDCINRYQEQGYAVSNGWPNDYVLRVGGAVLSGRPEVIATKGDDCVVIDFHDGEATRSRTLQVMVHMYALPRAIDRFRSMSPRGEIAYPESTDGGRQVSVLKWPKGAPLNLG